MSSLNLSIGLLLEGEVRFPEVLKTTLSKGYCFVCVPLNINSNQRNLQNNSTNDFDFSNTFCDMDLSQEDWTSRVVGYVDLLLISSTNHDLLFYKMHNVEKELAYGNHLNLCVILVSLEGADNIPHIAGICKRQLSQFHFKSQVFDMFKLWMCVKINAENNQEKWEDWTTYSTLCNYNKNTSLALELDFDYNKCSNLKFLNRWVGENLSAIILPTKIFLTNKKEYPILSQELKHFTQSILKLDVRVIIRGQNLHHVTKGTFDLSDYYLYIKHIHENMPPLSIYENHSLNMRDVIQIPLQPLADNLESSTYDVFEQDPIKYNLYRQAVYKCLCDKYSLSKNMNDDIIIIMVVGCGRGPLVKVSRDACIDKGCKYMIYALEKNPNAIITLEKRAQLEWTNVTVINEDMRDWNPPHKADIIVSELLGSFGDNELSPECLDGAERLLKEDGVSIPCSYCSYLVPVSAQKAYSEIVDYDKIYKGKDDPYQIPYVFTHPKPCKNNSNERFIQIQFPLIYESSICHGFAGYFSCVLYDDIIQSIHPDTHSPDMFSWFPIFFPLKNPIELCDAKHVTINMWRFVDNKKVWYEWAVTSPVVSMVHNSNGEHYHIDLY